MPKVRNFMVLPALPDTLKALIFIARNMFWTWNPEFVDLFKRIDSHLWTSCGHNPVKLLASVSQKKLEALADNPGFICELQKAEEKLKNHLTRQTWFEKVSSQSEEPLIAYFSAEFGIHECLPVYSGGLGILAGDHLKSASDLGIPLVAVGLLYQKGYFRQYLNIDGWQQEVYAENDFYNLPIELVKNKAGSPVTITVEYPGRAVHARIWCVSVGRVKLYLLDTNTPDNSPTDVMITTTLYGGDREMRIRQEIMLGIGGLRALRAVGINPDVCHMNEGHAAFLALERIRLLMAQEKISFEEAAEATKAGNIFTIHTPVKAGLDEFSTEMMDKYFKDYFPALGIDRKRFLALGRINPNDDSEPFEMPILALRLSSCVNGVSKLHGEVSRMMWSSIWPGLPVNEVPIGSVTNGVHIKTWLSDEMNALYQRYIGANWAEDTVDEIAWGNIENIPDEELWRTHQRNKERLIVFARNRLKAQMQRRGTYHTELNWAEEVLDPEALTIVFARRFATYKRGNLLLNDPQRLVKILSDANRPVQIIYSGKAHPRDKEGKEIIRRIIHFANQYNVRRRIVFLEDYGIDVARVLVQGADVWLNNPRRPMEASGTSGMKAAINGLLNMSTLDGWWCEGYKPEAGWVIGSGETYDDPAYQDMVESKAIYNLLENEVVPLFYTRSTDGLPRAWIRRMKNSIFRIAPFFNSHRMLAEYTQKFYNCSAERWRYLTEKSLAKARELSAWKANLQAAWSDITIKDVQVSVDGNGDGKVQLVPKQTQLKVGARITVKALVKLGAVVPNDVSIELYHGHVNVWGDISSGSAVRMDYVEAAGDDGEHWFTGSVSCQSSGRQGLAVRILPNHDDLSSRYEPGMILWETADSKSPLTA